MAAMKDVQMTPSLRYERLNGCSIPAFNGHTFQRLEFVLSQTANQLKVAKKLLRCRRGHDGVDPHLLFSATVDFSHPRPKLGIELNRKEALGPDKSGRFILHQKPDFMILGQNLQRATDRKLFTTDARYFAIGKSLLGTER